MGNCQAAEAATVVIHHPGKKVERIYWSISASKVMCSNPGHYVAIVVTSRSENASPPVKHLKLLRPDDTLVIGHVYRLVSFEDMLKLGKKGLKLVQVTKETRSTRRNSKQQQQRESADSIQEVRKDDIVVDGRRSNHIGRHSRGHWRPALHTIQEVDT